MINEMIKGIAADLKLIYPDKNIYSDEVPEGADDSFFIDVEKINYEKLVSNSRKMTVSFHVYYFCKNENSTRNIKYFEFAENMTQALDIITVSGKKVGTHNHKAERNDDTYRFGFEVSLIIPVKSKDDFMESLKIECEVKE